VSKPDDLSNLSNWKLEISSFLKELKCPHTFLFTKDLDQRLKDPKDRLVLLEFLLEDLLVSRIIKFESPSGLQSELQAETQLRDAMKNLHLESPTVGITPKDIFGNMNVKINQVSIV
jgi:hypothetical protein